MHGVQISHGTGPFGLEHLFECSRPTSPGARKELIPSFPSLDGAIMDHRATGASQDEATLGVPINLG